MIVPFAKVGSTEEGIGTWALVGVFDGLRFADRNTQGEDTASNWIGLCFP